MKYSAKLIVSILVLAFTSAGRLFPAPLAWPEYVLRGANVGIFPGWPDRYSEEDIAHLALDLRANSVRVLINDIVPATAPYKVDEATRLDLFKLIDYCLKYRLYTVIAISSSSGDQDAFFANADLKTAFRDFWVEIATHYAGSEGVAYDLMNEPHDNLAVTQWSAYARELTAAIRTIDSIHTLVIEPPAWGWPEGFASLTPTGDENTIYSFHFYGPMDYTHQRYGGQMMSTPDFVWRQREYPGVIVSEWGQESWDQEVMRTYVNQAVAFRDKYNVRLWCGEFGCARWALGAEKWFADWVSLLEEEGIDWSYYAYREWHHMDLEMDPAVRTSATERSETPLTSLFRDYFGRNDVPLDFNRDGIASPADIIALLYYQLSYPGSLAADYNRDGRASVADAMAMLLRLVRNQ